MDLGIKGRVAVVCASTHGLGRGCAEQLALAGVKLFVNGRTAEGAEQVAAEIRAVTGAEVTGVGADLDTTEGQDRLLAAAGEIDILVNNNGGPPFLDFREVDHDALMKGVVSNMATPIRLVQRVVDGMIARKFGRIVNITSASVKRPLPGLDLSSGARAGLTGFLAGVARSVAHANVTINFLLPGPFDTRRMRGGQEAAAKRSGLSPDQIAERDLQGIPARRFGTPSEFGAMCAFLCSTHAGFITAQSILMDGGAYPGIL